MNLFGGKRTISVDQVDRLEVWARGVFHLSDETTVMVTELACREPGCPPTETVIAVLKGPGDSRQYRIHKTADEIDVADIEALALKGEVYHDRH